MYLEARGPAQELTVISSAFSADMISWEHEDGFRLSHPTMGFGGPRIVSLPGGGLRLYLFTSVYTDDGPAGAGEGGDPTRLEQGVMSATSADGLEFSLDPGWRLRGDVPLRDRAGRPYPSNGITAADVLPPALEGGGWTMYFSAWEDDRPARAEGLGAPPPELQRRLLASLGGRLC
jgi:hypothetical protein